MSRRSPLAALPRDRTVRAVLAVVVLALAARLVFLGARVAHQDEARVGFWTIRYAVSGRWEYRPIVHGPFIPVVNRHLFGLFGASDFVARLPMAIIGGVAPLASLLFRKRLRDAETVVFALLLAANPVLLYYSRFMRQDVPLAVFVLFGLGFAIRALDATEFRWRRRYVLLSSLMVGLAFTTKENAVLYPVAWIGAALLVADVRLTRHDAANQESALSAVRSWVRDAGVWRVAAGIAFLLGNPLAVWIVGVPGDGASAMATAGFCVLVVLGVLGYVLAVDSPNPLHYFAGIPLAVLVVVAVIGAVPGPVIGPIDYVYDRLLAYYAVSWLLGAALLVDVTVVSRSVVRRGRPGVGPESKRRVAGNGSRNVEDDDPDDATADRETDGTRDDEGHSRPDGPPSATGSGRRWFVPPMLGAFLLFFLVVILFYAPRGGGYQATPGATGGMGLGSALAALDPGKIAAVVWEATVGTWGEFVGTWTSGGHQDHPYLPYFADFAKTMVGGVSSGALTVSVAGGLGLVADRYGEEGPRNLVQFAGYWGIASVLGYPLVTDIPAPWSTVHAIVPLAIPAAVALALVYRRAQTALARDSSRTLFVAVLVGILVTAQVGLAATTTVYLQPQSPDNELVQYAQSSSTDLKPVLNDVKSIARDNEGVDVLYVGEELYNENESLNDQPYAGSGWFDRLPIAWYTETWAYEWRDDPPTVVVDSIRSPLENVSAPVVITVAKPSTDGSGPACEAPALDDLVTDYRLYCGQRYLYDSPIAIFVDADRVDDPAGVYDRVVRESTDEDDGGTDSSGTGTAGGTVSETAVETPVVRNGVERIDSRVIGGTTRGDTVPSPDRSVPVEVSGRARRP